MQTMTAEGIIPRGSALEAAGAARWAGIDRLRVLLTVLVIVHHCGQAYGPTGGSWPVGEPERATILGVFFAVNAAFFMGLFFLLAGLFTPAAYDRRGGAGFLGERLRRLGLPLLIISLLALTPIAYYGSGSELPLWRYLLAVLLGRAPLAVGHLWFVMHLLAYALIYALWRSVGGAWAEARISELAPPGHLAILAFTVLLAGVTLLVRQRYPLDTWVSLFGVIPAEVAHLPQYLSLFVIGLVAGRAGWLQRLPRATGMAWLAIGLAAAALRYAYSLGLWRLWPGLASPGSPVWSCWETLICVGLCVGLPALFRDLDGGRLAGGSAAAYSAYLIHVFPVVLLQAAFLPAPLPPLLKFALVCGLALPITFLLAAGLRRLPGVGRLL